MLKFGVKRLHLMLFAGLLGFSPLLASADVSITIAPPPIPVYDQPPCPDDGYLWTPGWWGFAGGFYGWHPGFWGPHIGFYGGVNYGFGYFGTGFWGGRWEGGHFFYNSACWHVGAGIHGTYVNHSWVEEHNRG